MSLEIEDCESCDQQFPRSEMILHRGKYYCYDCWDEFCIRSKR